MNVKILMVAGLVACGLCGFSAERHFDFRARPDLDFKQFECGTEVHRAVEVPRLSAGFARIDITPPLGSFMPGYYQDRRAKSVLDPLQINMLAFSDGVTTALVAQVDTLGLSEMVATKMLDAVSGAIGVNRDAILLHASHTHDGGYLLLGDEFGEVGEDGFPKNAQAVDRLYFRMCVSRVADAAVEAVRDLKPAGLSVGRTVAKRISFGRRWRMRDGSVQTNPGTNNPDAMEPVDAADETGQVLRIDRVGAKPVCVINFQTHPDVVGGETITADWPGLTRGVFEAATQGEALCIVINGTQGDVNHCNVKPLPGELNGLTRDFDAVDRGYDHARHMANVLAASALSVWMKCEPVAVGPVRFARREIEVPVHKASDTDAKNLAWAERIWGLHASGKDEEISKELGCREMQLTTEVARAGRIRAMAKLGDVHLLSVWGLSIGDVAFGAFPGEPFTDIGIAVRTASPFKMTLLSCLTNGCRGYFPSAKAYEQDGYESASSPFGPSVAERLIGGMCDLLHSLNGKTNHE